VSKQMTELEGINLKDFEYVEDEDGRIIFCRIKNK
jgi:hypothetical protein